MFTKLIKIITCASVVSLTPSCIITDSGRSITETTDSKARDVSIKVYGDYTVEPTDKVYKISNEGRLMSGQGFRIYRESGVPINFKSLKIAVLLDGKYQVYGDNVEVSEVDKTQGMNVIDVSVFIKGWAYVRLSLERLEMQE